MAKALKVTSRTDARDFVAGWDGPAEIISEEGERVAVEARFDSRTAQVVIGHLGETIDGFTDWSGEIGPLEPATASTLFREGEFVLELPTGERGAFVFDSFTAAHASMSLGFGGSVCPHEWRTRADADV